MENCVANTESETLGNIVWDETMRKLFLCGFIPNLGWRNHSFGTNLIEVLKYFRNEQSSCQDRFHTVLHPSGN